MNVKDYRKQIESQLGTAASGAPAFENASPVQPQRWQEAIRLLGDPNVDASSRKDAAKVLQAGTFLGAQFAPYRAAYIAALRTAATAEDGELRKRALDALVNLKDEFARRSLVDGLREADRALVPPAVALGLLARDDHNSAVAVAREMLTSSTDAPTRAQAIRLLGADPTASDLLSNVMKDKSEFREVRRASAVALRGLAPRIFESDAREILSDASDYEDIKSTVGGALTRAGVSFDERPSRMPPGNKE
jgi:hypothetical protein